MGMIVGMTRWWLPLVCGLLQLVSVSVGSSTEPPGWAASVSGLLGLVAGLALVARRRYPMVVLLVAVAGQVTQVMIAQPVFPVVTTVAVFTVARSVLLTARSPVGPAAALSGAVVAVAGSVALAGQAALAAPYALLLLVGILTGLTVAVRAGRAAAARREAMHAERLRIARDLHDTVGHGLGAITVQAGAGRLAVAAGAPEEATRALQAIEEASRAVLRDVRWMVGMLRDDQDRPGVQAIGGLVDTARRAGLDVTLDADELPPSVTADTGEAAYRIVQVTGDPQPLRMHGLPACGGRATGAHRERETGQNPHQQQQRVGGGEVGLPGQGDGPRDRHHRAGQRRGRTHR